jgi:hypothetical protein
MSSTRPAGTTSEDYGLRYFSHYSDTEEDYDWESPGWRAFFTGVARRTLELTGPAHRTLDVGCAKGLLVMAFLQEGCDAFGVDISEASVAAAPEVLRERVRVGSATDPIEGEFDLVTCTEMLEHLSSEDAERAIDNMCAVTDRIVLSSTPGDFDEPTHINVHPVADWVAAFATRGFFRRTDVDLSFLAPWAVYFERATLAPRDVVHRYETFLYPLRLEVGVKRDALLEASRTIARLEADPEEPTDAEGRPLTTALQQAEERIRTLEHDLLRLRDHAIACEAIVGTARLERDRAGHEAHVARQELQAVRASERWRLGGALLSPVAAVKRRVSS